MLSQKKKIAEKYLDPFVAFLSKVNPNVLTVLGSIPSLLFFTLMITHHYALSLIIFFVNVLDLLDGMVARKYHKVTAFGGFLDSTLDRVSDFFIIISFAFGKIARWEIVAPLLLLSFLTSYVRSRGELATNNRTKFDMGMIERPERLVLIFLSLFFYTLFPNTRVFGFNLAELLLILLLVASFFTVLQRIVHAYRNI